MANRSSASPADYRAGDLVSGELKEIAIDRITEFLAEHQRRRAALGSLEVELKPYWLTAAERGERSSGPACRRVSRGKPALQPS